MAMGKVCDRCGRRMEDGSVAYEVRIQVYADFDGVVTPPEAETELDEAFRVLVGAMSEREPDELMREVYHTQQHLLCPSCRERYLANPLNIPLREDIL